MKILARGKLVSLSHFSYNDQFIQHSWGTGNNTVDLSWFPQKSATFLLTYRSIFQFPNGNWLEALTFCCLHLLFSIWSCTIHCNDIASSSTSVSGSLRRWVDRKVTSLYDIDPLLSFISISQSSLRFLIIAWFLSK